MSTEPRTISTPAQSTGELSLPGRRSFLTAVWSNLINVTWRVPPELLRPHVPPGVELDVQEGEAFVSLVGFDFLDTRVLGVSWPGFRDFPELNLRSYVKRGDVRGVFFLREYVPSRLVAAIARLVYNEPYRAAPMRSGVTETRETLGYSLEIDVGGRTHRIAVTGSAEATVPGEDTPEHYFKEHRWGFGVSRGGAGLSYEVLHPVWAIREVRELTLDVDFAALYGAEWALLGEREPELTVFAVGSEIAVYPKGRVD